MWKAKSNTRQKRIFAGKPIFVVNNYMSFKREKNRFAWVSYLKLAYR